MGAPEVATTGLRVPGASALVNNKTSLAAPPATAGAIHGRWRGSDRRDSGDTRRQRGVGRSHTGECVAVGAVRAARGG